MKYRVLLLTVFFLYVIEVTACISINKKKTSNTSESIELATILSLIRQVLPPNWIIKSYRTDVLPLWWYGDPVVLEISLEDPTTTYVHEEPQFEYHPFVDIGIAPANWNGKFVFPENSPIQEYPLVLKGKGKKFILLGRTLGETNWPTAFEDIAKAIDSTIVLKR